eukprot:scaffold8093_cov174-Skeletonema_marinoi.AAC.5
MSSLPKPQDSMLRDVVVDDDCACRLKRDVCDGANAMVCVEKSAIAAEAWATRVLLMVAAFGCMLSIDYVWSSNGCEEGDDKIDVRCDLQIQNEEQAG